jgi:hypothetical protein
MGAIPRAFSGTCLFFGRIADVSESVRKRGRGGKSPLELSELLT